MAFESNTGLNVSNYYGARFTGGEKGSLTTQDNHREYVFDTSESGLPLDMVQVVAGRVLSVRTTGTGAITTMTVGGTDVKAAAYDAPVTITGGALNLVVPSTITTVYMTVDQNIA